MRDFVLVNMEFRKFSRSDFGRSRIGRESKFIIIISVYFRKINCGFFYCGMSIMKLIFY